MIWALLVKVFTGKGGLLSTIVSVAGSVLTVVLASLLLVFHISHKNDIASLNKELSEARDAHSICTTDYAKLRGELISQNAYVEHLSIISRTLSMNITSIQDQARRQYKGTLDAIDKKTYVIADGCEGAMNWLREQASEYKDWSSP